MPGRWPWKVDCTDDSSASDVAAVVVPFFGHVDGEERALGDFAVGGVLTPATSDRVLEAYLGDCEHGRKTGSDTKIFQSETSLLRHQ
jgi:hypothetical protein